MNKTISFYDQHAKEYSESTLSLDMSPLLDKFISYLKPKAKILDLGAGSGRDTLYFLSRGFNVCLVDGSLELSRECERNTNTPCRQLLFQELDYQAEFDGVWANASLLHLEYDELEEVLSSIKRALKKNGILYCSFKKGEYRGYVGDRYFTYLTLDEATRISKEFDIIDILVTQDIRESRRGDEWINLFLKS